MPREQIMVSPATSLNPRPHERRPQLLWTAINQITDEDDGSSRGRYACRIGISSMPELYDNAP
jgi:hypothetical protein